MQLDWDEAVVSEERWGQRMQSVGLFTKLILVVGGGMAQCGWRATRCWEGSMVLRDEQHTKHFSFTVDKPSLARTWWTNAKPPGLGHERLQQMRWFPVLFPRLVPALV